MSQISERAPAKINLTLKVLGRTTDGLHTLESVVAFADIADTVTLDPSAQSKTIVTGPFGAELGDDNILDHARSVLQNGSPTRLGKLTLEKNLPVAAGIGGGSADAAALLRIARRNLTGSHYTEQQWLALARKLGADVPVCFVNRLSVMTSDGSTVKPIADGWTLDLPVVLVNARRPVPDSKTAQVFNKLNCTTAAPTGLRQPPQFSDRAALMAYLSKEANDLTEPAIQLMPEIGSILKTLNAMPNCTFARLSGAGPTCFAVFENLADAESAAESLRHQQPGWWIVPTILN